MFAALAEFFFTFSNNVLENGFSRLHPVRRLKMVFPGQPRPACRIFPKEGYTITA
jgi:hypothetical protein